jgi:hypothetical protein
VSCPKWKVGGPGGPSNTGERQVRDLSCVMPNEAVEQTGQAGHTM